MRSLWTKLGVIFIIGLAIFAYSEGWGADWKYIGINAHGSIWEIDTTSISCQPNNIVRAWVKVTYSKEDVTDFWVKKFGEGCKDFSYSIELT